MNDPKVERVDVVTMLPFQRGAIFATADGTQHRVLGISSNGDERVIECIEGPKAGSRRVATPRELRFVAAAPPRDAPAAPAPGNPSGPGCKDRHLPAGSPNIVQGDFTAEMFAHPQRGPETVVLAGGPHDGKMLKIPHTFGEYTMPAVNPESDAGSAAYVPVIYKRTKRRSEDGLPVFSFDRYQCEPAAVVA